MRKVIVRYRVKPERVAEHEALIANVFKELAAASPAGLRYGAFKQPDGVSFIHIAFVETTPNPLESIAAFRAFTANVKDRCDELPVTTELTTVGAFGW